MELQVNRSGVKKSFIGGVGNLTRRTVACSGYWFSKIVPSGGLLVQWGLFSGRREGQLCSVDGSGAEGSGAKRREFCNKSYKFRAKMGLFLNFF